MDNGRPQSSGASIAGRSFGHAWYQAQRDNEQRCAGDGKPTLITILPPSAVGVFNCSVHVVSEPNIWFVHDVCCFSCFGLPWLPRHERVTSGLSPWYLAGFSGSLRGKLAAFAFKSLKREIAAAEPKRWHISEGSSRSRGRDRQ